MAEYFELEKMSKDELKDAVREHDHNPAKKKLEHDYNFTTEQVMELSKEGETGQ